MLGHCRRLPAVELALAEASGLVLAAGVCAAEDVPPFENSSMDGYALRAADVASAPATLSVIAELMAGDDPAAVEVGPSQAARIMTGAPLPRGADAVCMLERTQIVPEGVVIEEAVPVGTHVRPAGSDIVAGQEVARAGERLTAASTGILASLGVPTVKVYRRPRVGVVSTGDELFQGEGALPPGKIRDSNRPALLAQLRLDGFQAEDLGHVPDDADLLAGVIRAGAASCDAVVTSGGVSVGDRDIVKTVLDKLGGGEARWLQVAVRPAKPFAFSPVPPSATPVLGLPGNPVSALVSYELFARPALRYMAGCARIGRPVVKASAAVDIRRVPDGKLHLVRVALAWDDSGALLARPSGGQGSHQMSSLASAHALALLPDGDGVVAGAQLEVWLLDAEALVP